MMRDTEFDAAWSAVARADAEARAPLRLRPAVMAAWDAERHGPARPASARRRAGLAALAAAAALLAAAALWWNRAPAPATPTTSAGREPMPLVLLAADPTFDTESLQIVRVRMPGRMLPAFGIPLDAPEAAGFVEIDVLVGDDGLPRDIRGIRAASASDGRDGSHGKE